MSEMENPYAQQFFAEQRAGSIASAREVVPIVLELFSPRSVVDVGCGTGTWLSVFAEYEISEFVGIDGGYVDESQLLIPADHFLAKDLTESLALDRRFDLAVSLEVAEHLPPESSEVFVESLTRLASVVVFSAALPGQKGTNHLNEQWPSYWISRFEAHDFVAIDAIRPRLLGNERIEWWYRQNTLVFVSKAELSARPSLLLARERASDAIDLVSTLYAELRKELTARQLVSLLPRAVGESIGWHFADLRRRVWPTAHP
jgi:SAM-dependent methyltransferase